MTDYGYGSPPLPYPYEARERDQGRFKFRANERVDELEAAICAFLAARGWDDEDDALEALARLVKRPGATRVAF